MAKSRVTTAGRIEQPSGAAFARAIIRIPKTGEIVAANIRERIIRGELKEGDFLPPEAQLMERFGTSRPTIREAFRILENEQLIAVTRGSRSGARVQAPSVDGVARYAGFALQAQGTLLSDVYLARLAIEPFAVRLAARKRTVGQLAALRAELDDLTGLLERGRSTHEFRVAVFRLHHAIVAVAGSNTLTLISAMLQRIAEQHMFRLARREVRDDGEAQLKRRRAGLRSFRKLFDLLEAREADAAADHWHVHIRNANDTWLADDDQATLVDVLD